MGKKRTGKITIILSAQVKAFQKKMQRAVKQVTKFATRIKGLSVRVAKWGVALGAAAIGAMALMVRQSLKINDALGKTADLLGLSTEALAGFHLQARLSGVEVKTFDMALQRFVRRTSAAAVGTGEAVAAFKELKLDPVELNALGTEAAFLKIADAIKAVGLQADKVRLAMKLFDTGGVKVINTMTAGSKAFAETKREALLMGTALTRIETKKLEMLNDSLLRVGEIFRGIGNEIALFVTPFLIESNKRMIAWGVEGEGSAAKIRRALETVVLIVARVADAFQQGLRIFIQVRQLVLGLIKWMKLQVVELVSWLVNQLAKFGNMLLSKITKLRQTLTPLAVLDPSNTVARFLQLSRTTEAALRASIASGRDVYAGAARVALSDFVGFTKGILDELKNFDAQASFGDRALAWIAEVRDRAQAAAEAAATLSDAVQSTTIGGVGKALSDSFKAGAFAPLLVSGSAEAKRAAFAAANQGRNTQKLLGSIVTNTGSTSQAITQLSQDLQTALPIVMTF